MWGSNTQRLQDQTSGAKPTSGVHEWVVEAQWHCLQVRTFSWSRLVSNGFGQKLRDQAGLRIKMQYFWHHSANRIYFMVVFMVVYFHIIHTYIYIYNLKKLFCCYLVATASRSNMLHHITSQCCEKHLVLRHQPNCSFKFVLTDWPVHGVTAWRFNNVLNELRCHEKNTNIWSQLLHSHISTLFCISCWALTHMFSCCLVHELHSCNTGTKILTLDNQRYQHSLSPAASEQTGWVTDEIWLFAVFTNSCKKMENPTQQWCIQVHKFWFILLQALHCGLHWKYFLGENPFVWNNSGWRK